MLLTMSSPPRSEPHPSWQGLSGVGHMGSCSGTQGPRSIISLGPERLPEFINRDPVRILPPRLPPSLLTVPHGAALSPTNPGPAETKWGSESFKVRGSPFGWPLA